MALPNVRFGKQTENKVKWKNKPDDDPDDEQLDETPDDVIGMLGFDPADEDQVSRPNK